MIICKLSVMDINIVSDTSCVQDFTTNHIQIHPDPLDVNGKFNVCQSSNQKVKLIN